MNVSLINTCCFIGHRKIEYSKELENNVFQVVENLIVNNNIDTFLFGSRSEFNSLCYKVVSSLKQIYPHIRRIYVRGEYQYISDDFKKDYFLNGFEDTFLPKQCKIASKASYLQRNKVMIDFSNFCVFYYNKNYKLPCKLTIISFNNSNSGTKLAYLYAKNKNKKIINTFKF